MEPLIRTLKTVYNACHLSICFLSNQCMINFLSFFLCTSTEASPWQSVFHCQGDPHDRKNVPQRPRSCCGGMFLLFLLPFITPSSSAFASPLEDKKMICYDSLISKCNPFLQIKIMRAELDEALILCVCVALCTFFIQFIAFSYCLK